MSLLLRASVPSEDMFILLGAGVSVVGLMWFIGRLMAELSLVGLRKTNYSPWDAPQFYMLMAAVVAAVIGSLSPVPVDLQFHDTYFVSNAGFLLRAVGAFLGLAGVIYFVTRRRGFFPLLTIPQLVLSLGGTLLLAYFFLTVELPPVESYPDLATAYDDFQARERLGGLGAIAFLAGKALVLVNVLVSRIFR